MEDERNKPTCETKPVRVMSCDFISLSKSNNELMLIYFYLPIFVLIMKTSLFIFTISLIEFFNKMKKWEDMANLPPHFRERTERLERNFTVSAVIFKKYEPIFQDTFKYPQEEQPRQQRGRKQRYVFIFVRQEYTLSCLCYSFDPLVHIPQFILLVLRNQCDFISNLFFSS